MRSRQSDGSLIAEVFPQRRAGVFRLGQAAALQLGNDKLDELADVVHGRIAAAEDEAAVGAGCKVHFLQLVDDCLGCAGRDEDPIDQKAAAEWARGAAGSHAARTEPRG